MASGIGAATTEYDHDSLGRWTKTTSPLGREVEYTYYGDGYNLATVVNASGTTTYRYDRDDLGPHLVRIVDATGNKTEFEYDARGRLQGTLLFDKDWYEPESWNYVLSASSGYSYDLFGRLATAVDFKGQARNFQYDVNGGAKVRRVAGRSKSVAPQ